MILSLPNGGGLFATPIGGRITGRGADLIIIDDPHKIEDAQYPERLDRVCSLFDNVVRSRANNAARSIIIVVAHRIHEYDLSGRLLAEGGWDHLVLPLVAERSVSIPLAFGVWRRKVGEPLRPDAYPTQEIERLRRDAGISLALPARYSDNHVWSSRNDFPLFSDRPASDAGVVIERRHSAPVWRKQQLLGPPDVVQRRTAGSTSSTSGEIALVRAPVVASSGSIEKYTDRPWS